MKLTSNIFSIMLIGLMHPKWYPVSTFASVNMFMGNTFNDAVELSRSIFQFYLLSLSARSYPMGGDVTFVTSPPIGQDLATIDLRQYIGKGP